jgi:hypothetical protein
VASDENKPQKGVPPTGAKTAKGGVSKRAGTLAALAIMAVVAVIFTAPFMRQQPGQKPGPAQTQDPQQADPKVKKVHQGADSVFVPDIPDPVADISKHHDVPTPLQGVSSEVSAGKGDHLRERLSQKDAGGLAMAMPADTDPPDAPVVNAGGTEAQRACQEGYGLSRVTGACERSRLTAPPVPISGGNDLPPPGSQNVARETSRQPTPEEKFEAQVAEARQQQFLKAMTSKIGVQVQGGPDPNGTPADAQLQALEQQRKELQVEQAQAEARVRAAQQAAQAAGVGPT